MCPVKAENIPAESASQYVVKNVRRKADYETHQRDHGVPKGLRATTPSPLVRQIGVQTGPRDLGLMTKWE